MTALVALVALGGLALVGLAAAGQSAGGASISAGTGWKTDENGAVLTPAMASFLDRLAQATGGRVPITVTSGVRTPLGQARALAYKLTREGWDAVRNLYGQKELIDEILSVAPDVGAMVQVLEGQVSRGRYLSRHMRADALDLRTHGLSQAQLSSLVTAAEQLGAKAVIESDHLHLERVT